MASRYPGETARYRALAREGQAPETMVIACCDSRAAPEAIFDAGPGELFVVRNVANLVPPYAPDGEFHSTSAALEFAVQSLKVRNIVVMGHGRCGGIRAALNPGAGPLSPGDFIGKWMSLVEPAAQAVSGNTMMTAAERQTVARAHLDPLLDRQSQDVSLRQHPRRQGQAVAARRMVRHLDRRALGDEPRHRRFRAARRRLTCCREEASFTLMIALLCRRAMRGLDMPAFRILAACRGVVLSPHAFSGCGKRRHHHALVFDAGGRQ